MKDDDMQWNGCIQLQFALAVGTEECFKIKSTFDNTSMINPLQVQITESSVGFLLIRHISLGVLQNQKTVSDCLISVIFVLGYPKLFVQPVCLSVCLYEDPVISVFGRVLVGHYEEKVGSAPPFCLVNCQFVFVMS